MTDETPKDVFVEYDAQLNIPGGGWDIDLPVENIVASMDLDRVPYCSATLTLGNIDEDTWYYLDPRNLDPLSGFDMNVRFRIRLMHIVDDLPEVLQWLGSEGGADEEAYCYVHVRSAQRDYISGVVTVECSGREALMDDKKSIRTAPFDTGATTVLELVEYSLTEVFSGYVLSNDTIVGTTSIPAGDRRDTLPGESHSDLIEPELSAINCRLYDYWGKQWHAGGRDSAPNFASDPTTIELSTYTHAEGLSGSIDADPIVWSLSETLSRETGWGDGVLVRFDMLESGGTVQYQVDSGAGANTLGIVASWKRPKPADNAADQIKTRTIIRGQSFDVEARARFDLFPGAEIIVHPRGVLTVGLPVHRHLTGSIRSIEWDAAAATMRISAQSGGPVE